MLRVGLTGGIASGKSLIASVFESHGARLHRADQEAHRLTAPGTPAWERIAARFGSAVLKPDRSIDRQALGRIVFRDEAARRDLDAIVHPLVIEAMRAEAALLAREGRVEIYVSEAALIFEAGLEEFFDKIVVAWCRPEVQIARLTARDGLERGEAARRVAAQGDPEGKKARADYVIDTSGEIEETLARTAAVWAFLMEDARRPGRKAGARGFRNS